MRKREDNIDLKTREGYSLISEDTLHKEKELATFVVVVRNSLSKTWRLCDQLEKKLNALLGETNDQNTSNGKDSK